MEPERAGPWDELVDDPDLHEGDDETEHEVPGDLLELHEVLEYVDAVSRTQGPA